MKRGQTEIIGLVFIVLLISVGLLFFVRFVLLNPSSVDRQTFTQEQIATNFVNAFLLSSTNTPTISMKSLIQECSDPFPENFGYAYAIDCSADECACLELERIANSLLDQTLKEWGKGYELTISNSVGQAAQITHQGCPGTKDSTLFPIPNRGATDQIFIQLDVC